MNQHSQLSDLLPLFAAGALDRDQRLAVEQHLAACPECQADLALWQSTAAEITQASRAIRPPAALAEAALARVRPTVRRALPVPRPLRRIGQLLRSQMPLVHREIWPASAAVIGLGYIAALISAQHIFIYVLAPLVAAACITLIFGAENDPAYELVLSTPTSPRQILLARLVLVFGYNLALMLVATLGLLPVLQDPLLSELLLVWLAPMTFLSAAALVLSMWIGTTNAISLTYIAWLANLLAGPLRSPQAGLSLSPLVAQFLSSYQAFWQAPALLLSLSALLFAVAIWLAGRQENRLLNLA